MPDYQVIVITLVVNLMQCRITWEESPSEGLSALGWLAGMSIRDFLDCINYCGKTQPIVGSIIL